MDIIPLPNHRSPCICTGNNDDMINEILEHPHKEVPIFVDESDKTIPDDLINDYLERKFTPEFTIA